MDEKIFLVEEIKDINLEIGAANLFLQRAENQDELKVILAKGEMAHFHVTKQENQLEMSYKKNGKISREETDEIIVQIPENHHLENMSVSIGAGKLKAENITVMERLGLEVGAGKAKLKNMHVRNLAISKKQKKRPFSKLIPWILGKHVVSFDELMRISERNCFFYAGYDRFMQVLRRALRKPLWLRRPVLRCR